jgi:RNA polymerase sigma factor (sigma-70 family)
MSAQTNRELLSTNDGELLSHFAATGDQQAFSHLVARHGPMVLRICRRIFGGDPHGAEDAAQEVFLMLASRANALKTRMSVAGWLYRTSWHIATRHRRNVAVRSDHETLAGIERVTSAGAGDESKEPIPFALVSSELSDALGRALGNLPENYRNALVLHHVAGYTVEETAGMMGVKTGTAAAWMSRGRVLMRERLGTLVVGGITSEFVLQWFVDDAPPHGLSSGDGASLTSWSSSDGGRRAISAAGAGRTPFATTVAPAYACGKTVGLLGVAAAVAGSVPGAAASGAVISHVSWSTTAGIASTSGTAVGGGTAGAAAAGVGKIAGITGTAVGLTLAGGTILSHAGGNPRDASLASPSDGSSGHSHSSYGSSGTSASSAVPEPSVALPILIVAAFTVLACRGTRRPLSV